MSINKERMMPPKSAHATIMGNSLVFSLSLLMENIKEGIKPSSDHVDAIRNLHIFKNSFNKPYKYGL